MVEKVALIGLGKIGFEYDQIEETQNIFHLMLMHLLSIIILK